LKDLALEEKLGENSRLSAIVIVSTLLPKFCGFVTIEGCVKMDQRFSQIIRRQRGYWLKWFL
jgi:hypothetical protein